MGGTLREEQKRSGGRSPGPLGPGEPAELPSQFSPLQRPLQAAWVLGREDQERQEGGALSDPRSEEQERRGGHLSRPLKPRKPAGLPDEVPCPLRPGVRGTPGPLLFLEPKLHPPQLPGLFPALWVLSIGPAHHPNLTLA